MFTLDCVLFDLDGTLVDTAPDLIACLNRALIYYDFNTIDLEKLKPCISHGAATMVQIALPHASEKTRSQILKTLLEDYQHNILRYGGFFEGIEQTLQFIEDKRLKWGIVTNKRSRFTEPLVNALNIVDRAACIISGDTTNNSKPHPEPMLAACSQAQVNPENCVYIGDAQHDIIAGKAVNMKTLAAVYGYLTCEDKPNEWGADALVESPQQIKQWIEKVQCC